MQHKGKRKWQSFLFLKGVKGEQLAEKGGGGQGCWVTRHHAEEMVPLVSSIFGTCCTVLQLLQMMRVFACSCLGTCKSGASGVVTDVHFLLSLCEGETQEEAKGLCVPAHTICSFVIGLMGRDSTALVTLRTRFLAQMFLNEVQYKGRRKLDTLLMCKRTRRLSYFSAGAYP